MPDPATPNGPAVHRSLLPPGWPRPKGYANGIEAEGRLIFVGGQIGWDEHGRLVSDDFVEQTRQALHNVIAILAEAGAAAEHVTRMTWYVTDLAAYRERQRDLGAAYREVFGANYPAMTLVQVVALVEDRAKVEIECTAVVPHDAPR